MFGIFNKLLVFDFRRYVGDIFLAFLFGYEFHYWFYVGGVLFGNQLLSWERYSSVEY